MRLSLLWILIAVGGTGCSSTSPAAPPSSASNDAAGSEAAGPAVPEDFDAGPTDFDCLKNPEWTTVGVARYKNGLGHAAETLAVAMSADGGTYPVGTIVQLVPNEVSVKRATGFNAESHDWEFFSLNVSDAGATINARGGGSIVSNGRGTCLGCHLKAASQWDLICGEGPADGGTAHGCDPLPASGSTLAARPDPRCP